jgi:hypothetical protein
MFESELGLTIVAAIAGAVWTAFKGLDLFDRRRHARETKALMAVESGVEHAFKSYVKAIKAARADGKLTDAERKHARALATDTALRVGRAQGVNVARTLGQAFLPLWVSRMVRELKRRG